MRPLAVEFDVDWTSPTTVAIGAVIPEGLWVFAGGNGPVSTPTAFGALPANFVFSDGTMTANVAGTIYPVTAETITPPPIPATASAQVTTTRQPMRSLGAAATPRHMIEDFDDDDDCIAEYTIVHPGQTTTVWSDGWNARLCGGGQAMLIKTSQ